MKRVLSFFLLFSLLLSLCACSDFADDPRIGLYLSETDGYTLCLYADGTGDISYVSTVDGRHSEALHFTLRKDELLITGTAYGGAILGRSQYSGVPEKTEDGYRVTLYNEDTGIALGTFHQQPNDA